MVVRRAKRAVEMGAGRTVLTVAAEVAVLPAPMVHAVVGDAMATLAVRTAHRHRMVRRRAAPDVMVTGVVAMAVAWADKPVPMVGRHAPVFPPSECSTDLQHMGMAN